MNVVIVNETAPYPPVSGARIRTLNLMLRLARRHRITSICRSSGNREADEQADAYLRQHGIRAVTVGNPAPAKSGALFPLRLAANFFSPLPYSAAIHDSREVRRAIREHAATHSVDLWQFEWPTYIDAPPRRARRVIIAHDVIATIWQRRWEHESNPLRRWYTSHQWRKYEHWERHILRRADHIVAVSAEDARTFRERYGVDNVDVVDNGIDRAYFENVAAHRRANQILYLGNLESGPNLDAAMALLTRIFPAVRAKEPSAQLVIAGRNPPPSLLRIASVTAGVQVHANADDIRPLLAGSAVMAVPIRIGSGSRLKILEALACGLPVISTRVGAEGLALRNGEHLLVVDDELQMIEALVRAVRRPQEMAEMTRRGRELVLERYDWDLLARRLEAVWMKCVAAPAEQPAVPQGLVLRET